MGGRVAQRPPYNLSTGCKAIGVASPMTAAAGRWKHCVDWTGPRFEPQTSRSRDERGIARSIGFILVK